MYRLCRRSNLIPFVLILAFGIAASIFVPQSFPQTIGDIPMFALFPGEIAIALICSVLLFENASPGDLIKIAGLMLGIALGAGALGNIVTQDSVMMPESTLKLNWVQMIAFNLTGIMAVIAYYTNTTDDVLLYEKRKESAVPKEAPGALHSAHVAPHKEILGDSHAELVPPAESNKEILSGLDVDRINQLEQSIHRQPGKVSLESLFAEETQAASMTESAQAEQLAQAEQIAAVEQSTSIPPAPSSLKIDEPPLEETAPPHGGNIFEDVSKDIDNLFADIEPSVSQKDFSPPETAGISAIPDVEPHADTASKLQNAKAIAETAVKEFGRLSATASSNPNTETSGTIKSIGNMLLDTAAVERIIRQAEKTQTNNSLQVLTVDNGKNLQLLMEKLSSFEGIESALIIGKDGMLISNTESLSTMKYIYGPLSLAIHSTTNLGASKLHMGDLRQAILQSEDKLTILTDFGPGLLAVFGEWNTSALNKILNFINTSTSNLDSVGTDTDQKVSFDISSPVPSPSEPVPSQETESKPVFQGGLLDISENDLTDLIDGLLVDDSIEKGSPKAAAFENKISEAPPPTPTEKQPETEPVLQSALSPAAEKPMFDASSLLSIDDNEVAGLFDNLLSDDSAEKQLGNPQANTDAPTKADTVSASSPKEDSKPVLAVDDNEIAGLFDNLLSDDSLEKHLANSATDITKSEPVAQPEEIDAKAKVAKADVAKTEVEKADVVEPAPSTSRSEMKEFGKLSANAAKKPDAGEEQGTMKAIGRQLIDVQAVENIIKAGEKRNKLGSGITTARVISAARGEGIQTLLQKIDTYDGVAGSLIVGHDGLVIASTLKTGIDKEMMGAMCTAMHSHLDIATKKLSLGKLNQAIFKDCEENLTVLTSVAVGILAVFVDQGQFDKINGLLEAIEVTIHG